MAKIKISPNYLIQLEQADAAIKIHNNKKIQILFEALGIMPNAEDFKKMLDWDLISVSVTDQSMALQLNKLMVYVPNIIFEISDEPLFTVKPAHKKRRVRKDR